MAAKSGLSKRIQAARKAKDMSAADLARAIGVTRMAVSAWESGKVAPRPSILVKVANALGLSTEYLRSGKRANGQGQGAAALSVAELLDEVRLKIAQATGLPPERVRLRVEFIDPRDKD